MSDDFKEVYNDLVDIVVPDLFYFLKQIDCRDGCPVNTDGRGYMMALHRGDLLEGVKIARGPNPFASICGMICGAPCETFCRRDRVDKTLTIRAQKRYLDEWYGTSKEAHIRALEFSYARGSAKPKSNGLKVACVGAGVASLTCAHDLLRVGYAVDVFEMMPMPGGMLVYGVPNYRMKNDLPLNEIAAIEHLGAKIYCNTKVGRDITLTELQEKYDAVFIGNGLWRSRDLPTADFRAPDIIRGVEYLSVLCAEHQWRIGKHMVVVGGGNVAYDVARSSVRNGAETVTMICLESRDEQTADEFEIEDGVEEGIRIINRVGPISVERDAAGKISGIKVQEVARLFDHQKKFKPQFIPDAFHTIPCDTIALAIGQSMDMSIFNGWDKKDQILDSRGLLKAEPQTGRTPVKGIYAGGDSAFGPRLFITAIRHGQDAAIAIDTDLRAVKPYREFSAEFTQIGPMRDKEYLRTPWALPTALPPEQRIKTFNLVENNYTYDEAHEQANRCLQCHISPVFDGDLCIKCNGCVDVCPTNCLALIPLGQADYETDNGKTLRKAVDNFYGIDSAAAPQTELNLTGSIMLKDEDLCIRCGLCAEKCPTQAVTMDVMNYSFRWVE